MEESNRPNIMIGETFFHLKFFVFTNGLELHILIEENTLFALHLMFFI